MTISLTCFGTSWTHIFDEDYQLGSVDCQNASKRCPKYAEISIFPCIPRLRFQGFEEGDDIKRFQNLKSFARVLDTLGDKCSDDSCGCCPKRSDGLS